MDKYGKESESGGEMSTIDLGRRRFMTSLSKTLVATAAGTSLVVGFPEECFGTTISSSKTAAERKPITPKRALGIDLISFGADPTGKADISDALSRALAKTAITGETIYGGMAHIYRLDRDFRISQSNLTIDFRDAQIIGNGTIIFDGDSGVDGDWSKALHNIRFINARMGAGRGSRTKAPRFIYCIDSSMSNVRRHSYGDTGVEMFFCKRTVFRNITSQGGKDEGGGAIAALMLHCENCTFDGIKGVEGPFVFGIQVKGGRQNVVKNCSLTNVRYGRVVKGMKEGFYNRGDAPWTTSPTPEFRRGGYSYPYSNGGWRRQDSQRASIGTQFTNCLVENCVILFQAFHSEEFIGGMMSHCVAKDNIGGSSFVVSMASHGEENDFSIIECQSIGAENFGVIVEGVASSKTLVKKISVSNNYVKNAGFSGIYAKFSDLLNVSDNRVDDCCTKRIGKYIDGIVIENSKSAEVMRNAVNDDRQNPCQRFGISMPNSNVGSRLASNDVRGFKNKAYHIGGCNTYSGNKVNGSVIKLALDTQCVR